MFRWILLCLAAIGLLLAFTATTPGLLGLGILFSVVGGFGFVFALAADRVAANARPETAMASIEELAALRKTRAAASNPPPVGVTNVFDDERNETRG